MLRIYCLLLAGVAAVAADTSRVEVKAPAPSDGAWKVSRFSVDLVPGATGPALVATPQTSLAGGRQGRLLVSFDIGLAGQAFNVKVEDVSDRELEAEVIALIREWRFEAAQRGGIPIVVRGYLELELDAVAKARPRPKKGFRKL